MIISDYKGKYKITSTSGIPIQDIDSIKVTLHNLVSGESFEKKSSQTDHLILDFPMGVYSITVEILSKEDVYVEEDTAISIPPVDESILINSILLKAIKSGTLTVEELIACFDLFDYSMLKN